MSKKKIIVMTRKVPPTNIKVYKDKKRKVWLAGLLSFLLTGLGQVYNGSFGKGLLFLAGAVVAGQLDPWLAFGVWIGNIVEAVRDAQAKNQELLEDLGLEELDEE